MVRADSRSEASVGPLAEVDQDVGDAVKLAAVVDVLAAVGALHDRLAGVGIAGRLQRLDHPPGDVTALGLRDAGVDEHALGRTGGGVGLDRSSRSAPTAPPRCRRPAARERAGTRSPGRARRAGGWRRSPVRVDRPPRGRRFAPLPAAAAGRPARARCSGRTTSRTGRSRGRRPPARTLRARPSPAGRRSPRRSGGRSPPTAAAARRPCRRRTADPSGRARSRTCAESGRAPG